MKCHKGNTEIFKPIEDNLCFLWIGIPPEIKLWQIISVSLMEFHE